MRAIQAKHSLNNYTTFGSSLNTRGFSAGTGFRFGFNGKENFDKYQDYGFRIYYPELGKFLSTDPIKSYYPWNSLYGYAENKPIQSIDLDGNEELSVIVPENQTGFTKLAIINISMIFLVVSEGKGSVTDFPFDRFNDIMSTGYRTKNEAILVSKLPSATEEMDVLIGRNYRLAKKSINGDQKATKKLQKRGINEVYSLDIQFNVVAENGGTIEQADALRKTNRPCYSIIFNQITNIDDINSCPSLIRAFIKIANEVFSDIEIGGTATNSQKGWGSTNFVCLPTVTNMKLSIEERSAHEAGHNMSYWHVHCDDAEGPCDGRNFEYDKSGLGSNIKPSVSTSNLINIINDSKNRKTIH